MCNLEFPDLEQLYQDHRDQGFTIVGIATGGLGGGETEDTVRAFLDQTQVTFPIVWDDGTYRDFNWPSAVSPFPRQAVVDRDGRIVYLGSEHDPGTLSAVVEAAVDP